MRTVHIIIGSMFIKIQHKVPVVAFHTGVLTLFCLVDYTILINWASPFFFSFKGCLVYFFIFILFLIEIPVCK